MSNRSLLHLALPSPRLPERSDSARTSVAVSVMFHVLVAAALALVTVRTPLVGPASAATDSSAESLQIPRMVFLQMPGPGGGGGGGGNRQPMPPSRAQGVGHDHLTLPVARPVVVASHPADTVPAIQSVALHAVPLASGTAYQMGMPEAPPSLPFSQGPGSGGGVGEGTGTGIGPGAGPGLGPGTGGGFGDGAYRPGSGVVVPTLLKQVAPVYTPDAMERRIQGTVVLEVVVGRDGIPTAIRVARSLDAYGLDAEAIRAARQWRFTPGRLGDTPVEVVVNIVLDFRIH
ncbi:MAG: energy transducer TonB [Acidobacteria bacterium]|nr:MAG: energy transducer TonB [Acidobacteriota bacterium]